MCWVIFSFFRFLEICTFNKIFFEGLQKICFWIILELFYVFITVWFLFQFVLSQNRFVTIWVLLHFEFFEIISLSLFIFSPYCKISTLWGIFSLSLVTILVLSSKSYFTLILFSSQKIFLHYIVLSWFGFC